MSDQSFITDLDSLFLIAGLVALCLGFGLEWLQTRETRYRFSQFSLVLSVACGLFVVGGVLGRIPTATIATYTLIGLQLVALALILPVIRRSLSDELIHSLLSR